MATSCSEVEFKILLFVNHHKLVGTHGERMRLVLIHAFLQDPKDVIFEVWELIGRLYLDNFDVFASEAMLFEVVDVCACERIQAPTWMWQYSCPVLEVGENANLTQG